MLTVISSSQRSSKPNAVNPQFGAQHLTLHTDAGNEEVKVGHVAVYLLV